MINVFPGTETCFTPLSSNGLNRNLFPLGTAQHLDINYNILPFLCDLLKATTDNSVSPVLTEPPPPFDITPFTDFSGLTGVGDPRVSLGEVMTQTYIHFLPRVITQSEVRQAGGVRVIDNYICTADGTPIKQSETVPILLSLDLTGQKPYQYGAITIPPLSSTYEELMKIIYADEVQLYVKDYFKTGIYRHAEKFVDFVKTYFSDYKVTSIEVYEKLLYFLLVLKKDNKTIYIKYYSDVANKVACSFKLDTLNYHLGNQPPTNMAQSAAGGSTIPDYQALMVNPKAAEEWKKKIISNYTTTPELEYTNILANSALAISYFNSMASMVQNNQVSAVKVEPC
jgi:hypothetical protein